jgi:hypothetical protein
MILPKRGLTHPEKIPDRKYIVIFLMGILVLGISFAGCTQSAGTGPVTTAVPVPSFSHTETVTAAATIQQIMNETVPVPSVQTPATIIPASNETGYNESTNKDNNRNTPLFVENETSGGLFININRGGSVDGLKVFIARKGTTISPIEYSFLPDRTVVEGENKGYLQVKIPPDGHSDFIKLQPGNYTAYLPNWNGGEPEQQSFMIREDDITPIWFQGFSAAGGGGCGC